MKITGRQRIILPHQARLVYLITNRQSFRRGSSPSEHSGPGEASSGPAAGRDSQLEVIERASRAGCQLIQIREKDLGARELTDFTRAAIAVARPGGARVLVNDRLDVALASQADGVHLRQTSLTAAATRQGALMAGRPDLLIGVSTHSLAEAQKAEREGADFIVCGPVYPTRSGRADGPSKQPIGLENLVRICATIRIPVIALGGLNADNFEVALEAGAAGIAGIAIFKNLTTIETTVSRLRAESSVDPS
ncbi:MAG: thiamine phosphate synthase [Acidobacteriota bacterium]